MSRELKSTRIYLRWIRLPRALDMEGRGKGNYLEGHCVWRVRFRAGAASVLACQCDVLVKEVRMYWCRGRGTSGSGRVG